MSTEPCNSQKPKKFRIPHVMNWFFVILLFITLAYSIVTYIEFTHMQTQFENQILEIKKVSNNILCDGRHIPSDAIDQMSDTYLEYYNNMDQKFDSTLNKIIAFIACIFSVTTILNTVLSLHMPKVFEDNLNNLTKQLEDIKKASKDTADQLKDVEKASTEVADQLESVKEASQKTKVYLDVTNDILTADTPTEKINALTSYIDKGLHVSPDLLFKRGALFDETGQFTEAEQDYRRAKEMGLSDAAYNNAMGVLYNNKMDRESLIEKKEPLFTSAETYYKTAIAFSEEAGKPDSDYYCNLACLYQDYGKSFKRTGKEDLAQQYFSEAQKMFSEALKLNPKNATAYLNRAISFEELGHEHNNEALADYGRSIQIDPYDKKARLYRAELAMTMYNHTENLKYLHMVKSDLAEFDRKISLINQLHEKIKQIAPKTRNERSQSVDLIVAKIDEKIADLSVEEAEEHTPDSEEYKTQLDEARKNYSSALDFYKRTYAATNNRDYLKDIERIKRKIDRIP